MRHQVSTHLYAHLGLPDYADKKAIKKRYKTLCLKHHPDRGGDIEVMKQVNAAYDFLTRFKDRYDGLLKQYYKKGILRKVVVKHSYGYNFNFSNASATDSATGDWTWTSTSY